MNRVNDRKYIYSILLMTPAILLVLLCVFGMAVCALQVFWVSDSVTSEVFGPRFIKSFLYTFYIAFTQSLISILISFLVSYYLIRNKIENNSLYIPISIPHIVVAIFTIYIFAKNGIISHFLHNFGIIKNASDFPTLISDKYGIGIILAYVFKSSAYCLSVIYVVMRNINKKYLEVSKVMGVDATRYITDIVLPLIKRTLLFCFLITFVYAFGAYEIPFLLGNTQNRTLPILSYIEYTKPNLDARVISQGYNFIMFIVGIISILIYNMLYEDPYQ